MQKEKRLYKLFFFLLLVTSTNVLAQPIIYSQPHDTAVCDGVTISFEVVASNVNLYQWQENDGAGWYNITDVNVYASGENTSVLTITDAIIGLNNYQYRCYLEDNSGESVVSSAALLNVYEHPIIVQDPISATVCKNDVAVFDVEAENVSFYEWQENRGTGWYTLNDNTFYSGTATNSLEINTIFGITNYQYRCKVYNETCFEYSSSAVLTVYPIPIPFIVSGGGVICENQPGVEITLLDSEEAIKYELFKNEVSTGMIVEGTGELISFGLHNQEGIYSVRGINSTTSCINEMTGVAIIEVNEAPQVFDIIGTGSYCAGSGGTEIFLQGTQVNIAYELLLNGNNTGYVIMGTGGVISFNNILTQGSYSVIAVNQQTNCSSMMNGVIDVVEYPAPQKFQTTGGGDICQGQSNGQVILDGSELGVRYYLLRNSQLTSYVLDGTGALLTFDDISEHGVYSVRAENISSGCELMMNGFVELNTIPLPAIFNVSGSSYLCYDSHVSIFLNGSEQGVNYYLYFNDEETDYFISGTGEALEFSNITNAGKYQVKAVNQSTGCSIMMNNSVEIENTVLPIADAGDDRSIQEGDIIALSGNGAGGSGEYQYQWNPESLLDNPTISNPVTVPLNNSTFFTLQVQDAITGCISEHDTVVVTVQSGDLDVTAYAADEDICSGETVELFALAQGGTGNYAFSWYTLNELLLGNGISIILQPSVTTDFIVEVNDGNNIARDTIQILVGDIPQVFSLSGDSYFCQGSDGAEIHLSGSQAGVMYQLIHNGIDVCDEKEGTGNILDFTTNLEGGYTISSDKQGCSNMMDGSITVEKKFRPIVYAGDDLFISYGDEADINGTVVGDEESYNYYWTPTQYLHDNTVEDPVSVPLSSSMAFIFQSTGNEYGCSSITDTVLVNVSTMPIEIEITASADNICPGSMVSINAIVNGGDTDYNYMWYSNPPGFFAQTQNIEAYPSIDTWYYVVADNGQYQVSDSVFIEMADVPIAFDVIGGGSICSNSNGTELSLSNSQQGVYYNLLRDGESVNNIISGTGSGISFGLQQNEGVYSVIATNNQSYCVQDMNGEAEIYQIDSPNAFAGDDVVINSNESANLNGYGFGGSGVYAYHWSPADKVLNSSSAATSTINLSFSQEFLFEVIDQNSGCVSMPDTLLVNVSGNTLTASIQATPSSICSGQTVSLNVIASGGSGHYTYHWYSDPAGYNSSIYNPIVTPQQSTLYNVDINDGENVITKSVQVIVNASPVASAGDDMVIAYGQSASLKGSATGGSGNYSYQWQPQGLIDGENSANVNTINLFNDQQFLLHVMDLSTGCAADDDEVDVDVNGNNLNVIVNAVPNEVCSGQQVSLFAMPNGGTENYTFQWRSEPEGFYSDQFYTSAVINQDMTFYVTISDGVYQVEKSVSVSVRPSPQEFDFSGQGVYCSGELGTTLDLNGSEQGVSYQLLFNNVANGVTIAGNGNIIDFENIQNEGIYSVRAVNNTNMCSSLMHGAVLVKEAPLPQVFDVVGGGVFCENDEMAAISLQNTEINTVYSLYKDDEPYTNAITGTGGSIVFDNTASEGEYYVKAQNEEGCNAIMNGNIIITTLPLPEVYTSDDTTIFAGESTVLQAYGATSYLWNTVPAVSSQSVVVSPLQTSVYTVVGTNDNGCSSTDDVTVYVNELPEPEANAFSPNGDGINDIFLSGYEIKVFNKWGVVLYEGDEGWDGTYNGEPVSSGSYFYVRITNMLGEKITPVKGSVSIVRQ